MLTFRSCGIQSVEWKGRKTILVFVLGSMNQPVNTSRFAPKIIPEWIVVFSHKCEHEESVNRKTCFHLSNFLFCFSNKRFSSLYKSLPGESIFLTSPTAFVNMFGRNCFPCNRERTRGKPQVCRLVRWSAWMSVFARSSIANHRPRAKSFQQLDI